jgi:hypothetical protein
VISLPAATVFDRVVDQILKDLRELVAVALNVGQTGRHVYMLGTSLTALSHFGFALFADGFWLALLLRLLAGTGWAGTRPRVRRRGSPTRPCCSRWQAWPGSPSRSPAMKPRSDGAGRVSSPSR